MDFVVTIFEQGLIYGILALGVYITYKILDFPDLTVDGSFPLGGAVTALLITKGINPYLSADNRFSYYHRGFPESIFSLPYFLLVTPNID